MLTVRFAIWALAPFIFGFVFLAAGVSKLLRTSSVAHTISNYRLLPPSAVRAIACLLAAVESSAGILMLLSPWLPVYRLAWSLTSSLLLIFSAAIASALLRGLKIPCGCGLLLNGHVISWMTLGRNLLMLAVLVLDFLVRQSGMLALGSG